MILTFMNLRSQQAFPGLGTLTQPSMEEGTGLHGDFPSWGLPEEAEADPVFSFCPKMDPKCSANPTGRPHVLGK